ncbi:putative inorganic carbon transporter subunit DabA, partial [uncultured Roseovarius sp.]|uniref:putative inorganic carbon transporter subunit DabA n=1 Tax=uncultured Roseovarius sp. TaxID=293344 RepID=UPI00262AADA7
MFLKHTEIAPDRIADLLSAAEAAARALPPAFPLEATVAVNPFLGQTGEDLATASARLARVGGVRLTRARADYAAMLARGEMSEDDLAAALYACQSPVKPVDLAYLKARITGPSAAPKALPTVADLAAQADGTDWPSIIGRSFGLWAGGHFDRGQALWTPAPGRGAFAAWREWAMHDLTPEIAGLSGFCAHVTEAPDSADRAILRACERLGISEAAAETAFHRLYMDMAGWAQHARWLLWQAEAEGESDHTLTDLLAIRLIWEEAIFVQVPGVTGPWAETVAAHEAPVVPSPDQVIDGILQEAAERAYQRRLAVDLRTPAPVAARPALQAAFCIDVRSEVFRRALESLDPGVETIGFAGFFGLPVAHCAHGSDVVEAHLPVLLQPALNATSHAAPEVEQVTRISARATRAWGRFRQAAVSSFAFVEAAGPFYGAKLVKDALGLKGASPAEGPAPRLDPALDAAAKAETAAKVLRAMSLTTRHARLVLLLGHGAQVTNNPHESGYHCGACGGYTGEVSARLLAQLLNDPETRAGLPAHGIEVPQDTHFMAGLHDTARDAVTLYPDSAAPEHAEDISRAGAWLARAGALTRGERAP